MVIAFLRTIILYLFIIVGIRLMGKRQVGELEPSELVLALLIADLAAVPMQDFGIPLLTGIIPILTLLCLTMALSVLTMKSVRFRAVLCGRPSIIVENGKLHQREMQKNRFTVDELMEELRMKGITDLNSIKYAILETNGQISVLPYAAQQPVTAAQMELHPKEPGLPLVIINDGRVLEHNLRQRGLDDIWLTMALSVLTMKSVRFRAVLCGRPSIIVENGKLHQREMQKNRFTVDELMEELRMKGITDLNSIKYAILETNGQISVLPYAAQQPVTAAQMELHPKEPGLPLVIINDGRVLEHNLRQRGLDDIWLDRQLKAHHVKRSQDVFLLTVDEQNQVYLAEKEGRV